MTEMNKLIKLLVANNIPFEVVPRYDLNQSYIQIMSPSENNRKIDAICNSCTYGGSKGLIEIYDTISDNIKGWLSAEEAFKEFKNVLNCKSNKYVIHVSMRFTKNFTVNASSEEEAFMMIDNLIDQLDVNDEGWTFIDENKDVLEVK